MFDTRRPLLASPPAAPAGEILSLLFLSYFAVDLVCVWTVPAVTILLEILDTGTRSLVAWPVILGGASPEPVGASGQYSLSCSVSLRILLNPVIGGDQVTRWRTQPPHLAQAIIKIKKISQTHVDPTSWRPIGHTEAKKE